MKLTKTLILGGLVILSSWGAGRLIAAKPATLVDLIHEQQRHYVRESTGVLAHECFTDLDLEQFKRAGIAEQAARRLKRSPRFVAAVLAIKAMSEKDRQHTLAECLKPLHPTWAQMGRVSKDGAGQTLAGQQAEIMIARTIVSLVEELLQLPVEEIERLA